jgi:hypothetical protein
MRWRKESLFAASCAQACGWLYISTHAVSLSGVRRAAAKTDGKRACIRVHRCKYRNVKLASRMAWLVDQVGSHGIAREGLGEVTRVAARQKRIHLQQRTQQRNAVLVLITGEACMQCSDTCMVACMSERRSCMSTWPAWWCA